MSAQILPPWQRALLRWLHERQLRNSTDKGRPCLQCREAVPCPTRLNDTLWDMVATCPKCGHLATLMELGCFAGFTAEEDLAGERISTQPPAGTLINIESREATLKWSLPAKGGCTFASAFGSIWCVVSLGLLLVALPNIKPGANWAGATAAALLLGLSTYIGAALARAGHRDSLAEQTLTLAPDQLVYERRVLKHLEHQSLSRKDITAIELVVAYNREYKPVYAIEIQGSASPIRFGAELAPEEKAWVLHELKVALGFAEQGSVLETAGSSSGPPQQGQGGILVRHQPNNCTIVVAPSPTDLPANVRKLTMAILTFVMAFAGLTLHLPASENPPAVLWLLINGMAVLWFLVFLGIGLVNLGTFLAMRRLDRTRSKITVSQGELRVVESSGSQLYERVIPATEIRDIRPGVWSWGQFNPERQTTSALKHQAVILLRDRAIGFGNGCDLQELRRAVAAIKEALE